MQRAELTMSCKKREMEDRISDLPEEILIAILSLLTLREAATTSIFSRRWQNIWKFCPSLTFDEENQLGRFRSCRKPSQDRRMKFAHWVNHVMDVYQGSVLDQLTILYDIDAEFTPNIDRWITFAINKRVTTFKLNLLNSYSQHPYNYGLPSYHNMQLVATSLENVSLEGCNLDYPSTLCIFKSLRSLSLKNLVLRFKLETILSSCLCLEKLCLDTIVLPYVKVAGSSLRIKYLEILDCCPIKCVVINAPNLTTLKYIGRKTYFYVKSAPRLVAVNLGVCHSTCSDRMNYTLYHFANYLFRLETLVLDLRPEEVENAVLPTLPNLKILVLLVYSRENFHKFMPLLKASPFLCGFKVHPDESRPSEIANGSLTCIHKCLEEIHLGGFCGYQDETELLTYFLKTATALKRIIIDPHDQHGDGTQSKLTDYKKLRISRDRARQFRDQLHSSVAVVVL